MTFVLSAPEVPPSENKKPPLAEQVVPREPPPPPPPPPKAPPPREPPPKAPPLSQPPGDDILDLRSGGTTGGLEDGQGGGKKKGGGATYCELVDKMLESERWPIVAERFSDLLKALSQSLDTALTFVQIGAHVGGVENSHDDTMALVKQHGWRGVLVEPSPYLFQILQGRYKLWPRLEFANVGVGDRNTTGKFWAVADTIDPFTGKVKNKTKDRDRVWWASQLGTFDEKRARNIAKNLPMKPLPVTMVDFSGLVEKFPSALGLHYLLIDTEGFDWKVLSGVDLTTYRPLVVVYEFNKLPGSLVKAANEKFRVAGYTSATQDKQNRMCFRKCTDSERRRMSPNGAAAEIMALL